MTTETTTNDTPADAAEVAADTALGAAAAEGAADAAEQPEAETKAVEAPELPEIIGAPEDYDTAAFTMPEGVEFDAELFDLIKGDLKEIDLSQKGAERIVGLFAEKVAPKIAERAARAIEDAGAELSANLARELQADPEVGGAKLKESQAFAARAIAHFIPDAKERAEFSKFLNESGLGNHRLLTRVIAGSGRALAEASAPAAESASAPLTASEVFYGRKA